jgi:hypothetical protein
MKTSMKMTEAAREAAARADRAEDYAVACAASVDLTDSDTIYEAASARADARAARKAARLAADAARYARVSGR